MIDLEEAVAELFAPAPTEAKFKPGNWAWRPPRRPGRILHRRLTPLWSPSRSFIALHARDWPWDLPTKAKSKNERRRRIDAELRSNRPTYFVVPAVVPPDPRRDREKRLPPFSWDFIRREANRVCSP